VHMSNTYEHSYKLLARFKSVQLLLPMTPVSHHCTTALNPLYQFTFQLPTKPQREVILDRSNTSGIIIILQAASAASLQELCEEV
jgi:hypothetical protein